MLSSSLHMHQYTSASTSSKTWRGTLATSRDCASPAAIPLADRPVRGVDAREEGGEGEGKDGETWVGEGRERSWWPRCVAGGEREAEGGREDEDGCTRRSAKKTRMKGVIKS